MGLSQWWVWNKVWGEARTRILVWYVALIAGFALVTIPLVRQRLFDRVDDRVRADLADEVADFQQVLVGNFTEVDRRYLAQLERQGRQIPKGKPQNVEELATLYEVYMNRQLPEDDTFLIAILEQTFYKSSPRGLPDALQQDPRLMAKWLKLMQSTQGEVETVDSELGSVLYIATPIQTGQNRLGVFVAAHFTAGERNEALESLLSLIEVLLIAFVVAVFLSWLIAGRVLQPLRMLSSTAQMISETDLSQRLVVQGEGEISELATTFNEMMDRLEVAFDTQRNFINDASHELRTPITIIRGNLELMGDDPQEQAETLTLVIDELDRMSRFVEDLLLLAKSERPDFLQLETVNLADLAHELFQKTQALAERDWRLDANANATVILDRQRITQAVINLAQNATQHTQPGDRITLGTATDNGQVLIWIADTGEGISAVDQQRIFERFARSTHSRRRSEGAGLGLAIVRAIAEAHNGKVTLSSQVGTGSVFTLVLPLEPSTEIRRLLTSYESNPHR
jgi:signal transduction histidine kinase